MVLNLALVVCLIDVHSCGYFRSCALQVLAGVNVLLMVLVPGLFSMEFTVDGFKIVVMKVSNLVVDLRCTVVVV